MIKELGLQMYSIREHLETAEDVRHALKTIKEMGYSVVQTAGQKISLDELADITNELGLTVCGTHCDMGELEKDPEGMMKVHRKLGTTNIGIGGLTANDAEHAKHIIKRINAFADIIYKEGFKFTYHNHHREFRKFNGKRIMDMMIEGLDPEKTSFCFDTYWVQHAGGDVCEWMEKLAGRIDILHLKDKAVGLDNNPFITEVGNGNMNFKKIIETAEKIGVKYYVVEQDICPGDSFDSVRQSSEYIHANFM